MKVKILQSIASPTYSYAAGQEVELSKERANEFIKHGIAKPLKAKTSTKKTEKETAKGANNVNDS